ncbi:PspC domain-containing protein [Marisediminicola sp. LYQ134]|uniref:PspC domain-containing protein n=1 Tax=Marisediminicola sp. LYQ134 TaxID=3391061 RepID=UPI0039838052
MATDTPGDSTTETPPPAPDTPPLAGTNRFFDWMRGLDLPRRPGWIGGVCAGIAERLGIDPIIVRGIVVVLAVLGGPALLLYAAAWLLLPDGSDKIHLEQVFRGRIESPIAGIGTLLLLSMLPVSQGFWAIGSVWQGEPYWGDSFGRALWTIVVLGLIVTLIVLVARRSSSQPGNAPGWPDGTYSAPHDGPAAATPTSGAEASFATSAAAGTAGGAAAGTAPTTTAGTPPTAPPAPPRDASAEEFAAWREHQALFAAQNDAFRRQQQAERHAASQAAQARARAERAERAAVERAENARTRSNPLFSFVVIGLSLIAGGLSFIAVRAGSDTASAVLPALSVTLAVLAVGIIINGVIGKRSGGASGVAIVVLTSLIITGLVPDNPRVDVVGQMTYTPSASSAAAGQNPNDIVVAAGDVTVDLREFYADGAANAPSRFGADPSEVNLVIGAGTVTVLLPADERATVEATVLAGEIEAAPGSTSGIGNGASTLGFEDRGVLRHISTAYGAERTADQSPADRSIDLTVTLGAGEVVIIRDLDTTPTEGNGND